MGVRAQRYEMQKGNNKILTQYRYYKCVRGEFQLQSEL